VAAAATQAVFIRCQRGRVALLSSRCAQECFTPIPLIWLLQSGRRTMALYVKLHGVSL
jgi:hypothetical protein